MQLHWNLRSDPSRPHVASPASPRRRAGRPGALAQTFDSTPVGYFPSQFFLIGSDGFTVSALTSNIHIDDVFCGAFGATEGVAIQSFRIRSKGPDRALIDDFAYVPVPEPGAAMLIGLGLGLAGLAGARAPGAERNAARGDGSALRRRASHLGSGS